MTILIVEYESIAPHDFATQCQSAGNKVAVSYLHDEWIRS
jgi:hypothetical protein